MNKVVLITGGSRGIGKAMVYKFARNGYTVILNYNKSEEEATKIAKELPNVVTYKADISNRNEVKGLFNYIFETLGRIDLLINNAGISITGLFQDLSLEEWNSLINVNVTGTFNCIQEALPFMISKKCGCIINISSVWGMVGASNEVAYSASKAAIIGLSKSLAKEVGPSNIRVNCITPGIVMTDMVSNLSIQDFDNIANEIPLGRIGNVEDVSNLAYFLSSDEAEYITGQVISPNGGWVI